MFTQEIKDKLIRIIIFIVFNLVLLRYISDIQLDDMTQIKIVLISTICYMFVSAYYPVIVIRDHSHD